MTEREELLTVEEAAEWLKMNPQTLRNYINAGRLRALRLGPRRVRLRALLTTFEIGSREDVQTTEENVPTPKSEPREQLGRAMDGAKAALAGGSNAELAAALQEVAAAAERLAAALEA